MLHQKIEKLKKESQEHRNCSNTQKWLLSNTATQLTLNTSYLMIGGSTADQPRLFYIIYVYFCLCTKMSSIQLRIPKINSIPSTVIEDRTKEYILSRTKMTPEFYDEKYEKEFEFRFIWQLR